MKRALVFLLFVLMLTAAWFRWFDEIDPETVKAGLQTQATIMKEKSTTFSFKDEVSQVIAALDRFFSPPEDEIKIEDVVELVPINGTELESHSDQVVMAEEPFNDVEEAMNEPTDKPNGNASEQPEKLQETTQFSPEPNMGYPAPVADLVVSAPTNQIVQDLEPIEVVTEKPSEENEQIEVAEVSESQLMEFNQLQESVPGSFLPFDLQSVEPLYTSNFVHPEAACNWMGVAGQIFGEDLEPKDGLIIVVEGAVNNNMMEVLGYSGLAQSYGPGGYELVLSQVNRPGIFWVQLFDVDGIPLSGIYSFQMNGTCEQNLAIINFTLKNDAESKYVPTVAP